MRKTNPPYNFLFSSLGGAFGLLALMAFASFQAKAELPPQFAFSIGSNQIPGGILPVGVGVDSEAQIYISSLSSIIKVDREGAFLRQWGTQGTGPGQFSFAGQIAVDPMDHLYVMDIYNSRVEEFTTNGDFITAWGSSGAGVGQFDQPGGLAVGSSERVYVADALNFRIQVFDSGGAFLKAFGSNGTNAGQFSFPGPIAIDSSNNLYVVDTPLGNVRVQKFDQDGKFLSQWGVYSTNSTGTIQIGGLATDSSNNLFIVDGANNVVQKYSSDGVFLAQWGGFGTGPGQFNTPSGIAVDPTGNYVYVGDYYNARINIFAYAGRAPLIYQPPTNQIVPAGEKLILAASVFGAEPLTYQWHFNGTDLPGATDSTLIITNVSLADSGAYSVTASNSLGMTPSPVAAVSVLPVVVTTLPVSGITATSALLFGNFWVGAQQSTGWFEWGTNTSYGNRVGFTNLSLFSSRAVPYLLNGLDGETIYHYRVAASNALGAVYGEDIAFQVGLKPTIQTLPVVPSADGVVEVGALVNPGARDTTTYFRWGRSSPGPFSTPTNQLPPGTSPLRVQNQLSGLVPGVIYVAQPVASNELGVVYGATVQFIAPPWTLLPVPTRFSWNGLAVSADGSNLVAVAQSSAIYVSHNSGENWISNALASGSWQAASVSADGTHMVAGITTGPAYSSVNSGKSWVKGHSPNHNWYSFASSGDGLRVAAVDPIQQSILTSTNAGLDWETNTSPVAGAWDSIASSGDGLRLIAAAGGLTLSNNGPVVTSSDGGQTWVSSKLPLAAWRSVASSADGRILLAAIGNLQRGSIYISTNYGDLWTVSAAPITNWQKVAVSADGSKLAALARQSATAVFTSTNLGLTWEPQVLPEARWSDLAMSADGSRLFASGDQNIFSLQTQSQPVVRLERIGNNAVVSWVITSTPFSLQQEADLSAGSWANVIGSVTTSFTNLTYQVMQPDSGPAQFYRLKSDP